MKTQFNFYFIFFFTVNSFQIILLKRNVHPCLIGIFFFFSFFYFRLMNRLKYSFKATKLKTIIYRLVHMRRAFMNERKQKKKTKQVLPTNGKRKQNRPYMELLMRFKFFFFSYLFINWYEACLTENMIWFDLIKGIEILLCKTNMVSVRLLRMRNW